MNYDPARLLTVLTSATLVTFPVRGGATAICDATEDQLELLRATKARDSATVLAKKALKTLDAVEEFEKELSLRAGPIAPAQKESPGGKWPAAAPEPDVARRLALVPYVDTVPPKTTGARRALPAAASKAGGEAFSVHWLSHLDMNKKMGTHYKKAFERLMMIIACLPVFVLYASQFYVVLALGYLLWHPEVVGTAFFTSLDAVPNYTSYAWSRVLQHFQKEIEARLR